MDDLLSSFYSLPVFDLKHDEKRILLNNALNQLNIHHYNNCKEYRNLINAMSFKLEVSDCQQQPYIVARLFKMLELKSISSDNIFKRLYSSGTSSENVSNIFLDGQSAKEQSKVLSKILQEFTGKQRLPMLLIDSPDIIKNKKSFSARGAGIKGLSFLGRDHTYALNSDMSINYKAIDDFLVKHSNQTILIFGFTFMIWKYLVQPLKEQGQSLNIANSILFHSGGWKKLQTQSVDNHTFKQFCYDILGNTRVHNFYGMVEQTGTVYVECEHGFLHTPVFSDILIRDIQTYRVLDNGEKGLIQLLSVLPRSYPGHSILTEDLGRIIGTDNCSCGRKGHYFHVYGRLPQSETRGCSDTYQ